MHFRECYVSVTEEHQPKLAKYQVKVLIWKWELLRWTGVPFNCGVIPLSRCACYVDHIWIGIETHDDSPQSNKWCNISGDNACATCYIYDTFTWLRICTLN